MRWRGLLCGLAVALLVCPAAGARVLHTVLEDDDLALYSPQTLPQFTRMLRWLGVDYLRVSAEWKIEAPDPNSAREPRGFAAADPRAYDSRGMRALDRAVRAAAAAGLGVIIDPAFSAPLWATTNQRSLAAGDPWYNTNIDLGALVAWETMLARRYSGHYVPPGARSPLPRAQAFTLWNEPNGASFLQPQWDGSVPVSADWYRGLVYRASPAIKQASPTATVLIGNTSDSGNDLGSGGVPPLDFIRRLACVDASLKPIATGACAGFRPLPADGFAHHPYERDAPPWTPSGSGQAGWAQMGDLAELQSLLDRLVAMGRLAPGARRLWLTEQGYESNGQLTERPWTEIQQAQLNADSEYLAWRDPRLESFSQFLLRDNRTQGTLELRVTTGDSHANLMGTWATGLERQNGSAKPALAMFRSPVVARIASAVHLGCLLPSLGHAVTPVEMVEVWGRARPLRAPGTVEVMVRASGATLFRTVGTDENGIFDLSLPVPAAGPVMTWFRWREPGGPWQTSPQTSATDMPMAGGYSGG